MSVVSENERSIKKFSWGEPKVGFQFEVGKPVVRGLSSVLVSSIIKETSDTFFGIVKTYYIYVRDRRGGEEFLWREVENDRVDITYDVPIFR